MAPAEKIQPRPLSSFSRLNPTCQSIDSPFIPCTSISSYDTRGWEMISECLSFSIQTGKLWKVQMKAGWELRARGINQDCPRTTGICSHSCSPSHPSLLALPPHTLRSQCFTDTALTFTGQKVQKKNHSQISIACLETQDKHPGTEMKELV